jgi:membrane-bound hydrogenase subunit beta
MTNAPAKLTPEAVVERMKEILGAGFLDGKIVRRAEGLLKRESVQIWISIEKSRIVPALKALVAIDFPHLTVISGCDIKDSVELNYHFYIYYGELHGEYNVTFKMLLPKTDLTVDTITGILPGALTSEREKQEFFGVTVQGIPDGRRMFLPEDFPQGVYPWRKDETGIQEPMIKQLHAVGKPKDLPADGGADVKKEDKP